MTGLRKILFLIVGFLLAFGVALVPSVLKIKQVEKQARVVIDGQIILADVALTNEDREQGLSGVKYMGDNEGMLFIFEEEKKHGIWMKDMRIPIDILWIKDEVIVDVDEHVMPEPDKDISELTIYKPSEPVDRVLEIRGGRFGMFDVEVGDKVEIESVIPNQSWAGSIINAVKGLFGLKNN
ncbi:MAG TPA: DUF192 domain-containing protein [Candidatus Paceibacterota bacterium]|nr:DUF192 domain-containing protein [Candidatus Paceibacterota bacterium]